MTVEHGVRDEGGQDGAPPDSEWRPRADVRTLRRRAELLARIRAFFAERDVLEVETPILGARTVTDPHIHSLATRLSPGAGAPARRVYLQTSPEFAMKRLLAHAHAEGLGAIYQICHVFRDASPDGAEPVSTANRAPHTTPSSRCSSGTARASTITR